MAIRIWQITDTYELIACGAPPPDWPIEIVDKRTAPAVEEGRDADA